MFLPSRVRIQPVLLLLKVSIQPVLLSLKVRIQSVCFLDGSVCLLLQAAIPRHLIRSNMDENGETVSDSEAAVYRRKLEQSYRFRAYQTGCFSTIFMTVWLWYARRAYPTGSEPDEAA